MRGFGFVVVKPPEPIMGADTETHHGYARLLCIEKWFPLLEEEPGRWREWLEYLLNAPNRVAFYNLRFDVEAILKHFPEEFIQNLLYLTEAEIKTPDALYHFKLIPWKVFTIRELRKEKSRRRTVRKIEMFDAAQFYACSLDQAANQVLGKSKIEDREFAASLNTSLTPWETEYPRIFKYCQEDANLTGQLIRSFIKATASEPLNLTPRNPISCAWYAKELLKQCIPEARKIKSIRTGEGHYYARPWKRYDNVGSQCYFGGRFEVFRKGTFHNVFNADINSAYPYWIAQLPNPYNLAFVKDYEPEGPFSMVKAEVWVPEDSPLGPLPYRTPESIIFPVGNWTGWFHWHELQNAHEKFGVEFQIFKALNGYEPAGPQRPFQDKIPTFYNRRLDWKSENDPRELPAKIAMNSVYGVLYEKNERITESTNSKSTEIDGHHLKKSKDNPGKYFHPFLAGWITSKTRVQLLNAVEPESIIFFATDGILTDKKPNLPVSKKLGEWGLDSISSARVFGNGLYELDGKLKQRGFRKGIGRDPRPVRERMVQEDGHIFVETEESGPIHINSAFRLKDYSLKDALTWIPKPRKMDITKCHKRIWPEYTINDLYNHEISSQVRHVNGNPLNRNPGLVWTGKSFNNLSLANRFLLGQIQMEDAA